MPVPEFFEGFAEALSHCIAKQLLPLPMSCLPHVFPDASSESTLQHILHILISASALLTLSVNEQLISEDKHHLFFKKCERLLAKMEV